MLKSKCLNQPYGYVHGIVFYVFLGGKKLSYLKKKSIKNIFTGFSFNFKYL